DGDGVKNDIDKCPNSTKGAPVGKDGCEIILANQISDQPSPFPNPIEDYISVQFPSTFGERVDVSIYNLIGQELLLKNNVSNGQIIPLNSLSVGNYLLEIQSVDKPMYRLVHKIVKK
ncbi:MAG: Secretion system C-terminal sorting domain, partial [Bacteroidota bacterium]